MKHKLTKKNIIIISIICVAIIGSLIAYFLLTKKTVAESPKVEETEPVKPKLKIVDEDSKSRPFAVMINNISTARPYQSGLQDAYLMYEIIVEGGITRYLAVFKDQNTERIGSVRSARHYFIDYAMENDAYYVHWGWSPEAESDIGKYKIDNLNGLYYEGKYFWRDKSLHVSSEHTGFTSIEKLKNGVDELNYRKTTNKDLLLNYSIDEVDLSTLADAIPATNVTIPFSNSITSSYTYDATNKYYLRSVNNKPHTDYVTKAQYHFKNIITYKVNNTTLSGDTKGRQTIDNIGTGKGYYISNGYAVPITWSKESRSAQTIYTYSDGTPIKVNDGNTFIEIEPAIESLTIS
jgi:hypothetical protein